MDRTNPKMGRRLDKFLVPEDLNIKEVEIKHIPDHFYKQELNMSKKFDHGAVRMQRKRRR